MKKILSIIFFIAFIFSEDILLDRLDTEKSRNNLYAVIRENKYRKYFYLLEIRQYRENNQKKCALYIFEKINTKKKNYKKNINDKTNYYFSHGFHLLFMREEAYFQGSVYRWGEKKGKFEKFHVGTFSYIEKKDKYRNGDDFIIIGNKANKKEIELAKRKKISWQLQNLKNIKKGSFYGWTKLLFFIPKDKKVPSFFSSVELKPHPTKEDRYFPLVSPFRAIRNDKIKTHADLNSKIYQNFNKTFLKFNQEKKSFRDKYYFDMKDLKAKGIAEPTPMWDAKVKPYKNVFGEELLD